MVALRLIFDYPVTGNIYNKPINPIIFISNRDIESFGQLQRSCYDLFEIVYEMYKDGKFKFLNEDKIEMYANEEEDLIYDLVDDAIESAEEFYEHDDSYYNEMIEHATKIINNELHFVFKIDDGEIYIDKNDDKEIVSKKLKKVTEFLKELFEYLDAKKVQIDYNNFHSAYDAKEVIELYLKDIKTIIDESVKFDSNDIEHFKHIKMLYEVLQEDYDIEISSWRLNKLEEKIQEINS